MLLQYKSEALVESVIPEMIVNSHPLPVLNAEGEVERHLCRSTLAEVLSAQPFFIVSYDAVFPNKY